VTKEEILKTLEDNREEIRECGVDSLALFGSFARGEGKDTSDLDFVVEFNKKSFDAYMDLKELLERLFNRKVDLVISDAVKPRLRSSILAEAIHAAGL
jgi:uncharacterized protein